MENITHTPVYADIREGYVRQRFYTFQARSHTVAYGEAENFFLSMFKNFVRIRTYGLYDKHTLGTR